MRTRSGTRWWLMGLALGLILITAVVWTGEPADSPTVSARLSVSEALGAGETEGFARAVTPRAFSFPGDHGPHPEFRNEWWYLTGNVETDEGREYGFQWTVFRTSLAPDTATSDASVGGWRTKQAYMGHFALTDVDEARHHDFERFSRGALDLAGARSEPFAVWLEDWRIDGPGSGSLFPLRLYAEEDGVSVELVLEPTKPMVLQGDAGLSRKGPGEGDASFYYSYTRLQARGTVEIDGRPRAVNGSAWLDREWSTSALAENQVGWDWFALQLSNGCDLMLYQMRQEDGSADPWSSGTLVEADGTYRTVDFRTVRLVETGHWVSPEGTRYPSGWRIVIPDDSLDLAVTPVLQAQEMDGAFRYWEGAVRVSGTSGGARVTGVGYVELTGYGLEGDGSPLRRSR